MKILRLILAVFSLGLLPASYIEAAECARMEKERPWDVGRERPVECGRIAKMVSPGLKKEDLPDLKRLLQADVQEAETILGRPFHCYEYN